MKLFILTCGYLCSCRCRRKYLEFDLEHLLAEKGIYSNLIMPRDPDCKYEHVNTSNSHVFPYLPLEVSLI